MSPTATVDPWAKALRHLKRVDPHLKEVIRRVGPCQLAPREDRLGSLVGSIVSQQISTKAAAAISQRLHDLAGRPYDPHRLLELGEDALRGCGLSGQKARYVLNLAAAVADGSAPVDQFDEGWDDEAIIESLTTIKGVGVWTAHMFLIFALNRPDVLPIGDLGVRAALRNKHGLAELPKPQDCHALAEAWRPFRSVASWYLWRSLDLR
ncbi:DNA-3-methyladenine glycosylase family protein [Paludisphaera mucosa]|uniref:DNA-3-methyladenine glycosylase II n=1 Tax=Paludisphaera mucosa TaxID=3030827 RepID=A0ABT6F7T5_9BACT|nr:DNA-3-methyladenine glycosylase [Paludisphaera mucosa]MDG3003584.1 DNA-3-methyladenine glycosylase [Paludisphaera mucosa]